MLTAVGRDRPGLVNELSSLVHRCGANLEDTRMAILGGEFAVLMLVSGSARALSDVQAEAGRLQAKLELKVLFKPTERPSTRADYLVYRLRVSGVDHPGIVHHIAQILAARQINVSDMESRLSFAPLSGTPMFVLDAQLQVPSQLLLADLRRELADACEQENLDYTLEAS